MFSNVLAGVDGRQGGRDAIALARELAAPEASLTLVHVYEPFLGRGSVQLSALELSEGGQLLERERSLAGVDAQLLVKGELPVGVALHELAEERKADLVVVGSTRHALLGRVLVGDDCRAALEGAPCALAIAPRGYATAPHRVARLGVGYDGSPESELALGVARELAQLHRASISAMWVVSLQDVKDENPIPADWPAAIDKLIDRYTNRLAQREGVRAVVTYGGPREELTQFGKRLDLLIVGSRNYGQLCRLFHGSILDYLVGHSACPLLVMPGGADESPADTVKRAGHAAVATAV